MIPGRRAAKRSEPVVSWLPFLLLAWGIVLAINVAPAFMPPSWAVMAAFRITFGVPLLPLTIGGAAMSAIGRAGLTLLSRRFGSLLPEKDRANAEALGAFVNRHPRWRAVIVFAYCLGPFPSNPVFIAAGVGRVPPLPVAVAFFLSRAIADTFWVWTAHTISHGLGDVFAEQLTSWQSIAAQVAVVIVIVLIFRLPWARWLGIGGPSPGAARGRQPDAERPAATARRRR